MASLNSAEKFEIVQHKELSAVVKKVKADFPKWVSKQGQHKGQIKLGRKLRRSITDYEQTNNSIFLKHTILPIRYGMLVNNKEEVQHFLSSGYRRLKSYMDGLKGMAEFSVNISWNLDEALMTLRSEMMTSEMNHEKNVASNPIELGRKIYEAVQKKKQSIAEIIHNRLMTIAAQSKFCRSVDETVLMH